MENGVDPFANEQTLLDKANFLQNGLIARATGYDFAGGDRAYLDLRRELGAVPAIKSKLPEFVRCCRSLGEFWSFIKAKHGTYRERREYIWNSFRPLLEYLEAEDRSPGVEPISEILEGFDPENVRAAWQKALDRRLSDPAGAITAARTLLETVCKHILDDLSVQYPMDCDLPKLWALAAEQLNLAPQQHQEPIFRAILGNCQSVVGNLAAIRNRSGDAHGQGRKQVKPKARHAELAVNLAGTMAAFLVSTWKKKASES